jgi:hypothetical protein
MSYGLKISKTGYDVKVATDRQLIYSSDWNNWKVKQSGYTDIILDNAVTPNHSDVTHNLGYIPTAFAYFIDNSGKSIKLPGASIIDGVGFDLYIDSTKIRIEGIDTSLTGGTWRVYYYIFYDDSLIV